MVRHVKGGDLVHSHAMLQGGSPAFVLIGAASGRPRPPRRRLWARWAVLLSGVVLAGGCTVRPPMLDPHDLPAPAGRGMGRVAETEAAPEPQPRPQTVLLGYSVEGRPLGLYRFGEGSGGTLIVGGIHGNEPTSADLAERLVAYLEDRPDSWNGPPVAVLPRANPDGLERGTRANARGVDLNRNFASANWMARRPGHPRYGGPWPESEPETWAILRAIRMTRPDRIVSIHSITGRRQCNNFDGPAEDLARFMSARNGYPVVASLGACHGSLGNWAGVDRGLPIITLELPRDLPGEAAWAQNRDALLAALRPQRPPAERAAREALDTRTGSSYDACRESRVHETMGG